MKQFLFTMQNLPTKKRINTGEKMNKKSFIIKKIKGNERKDLSNFLFLKSYPQLFQ